MISDNSHQAVLETLNSARIIADYAATLGADDVRIERRATTNHLGAVLADSALQAGVNYRTVVKPRVDRIISLYPETSDMTGIQAVIENDGVADYLQWKHTEKIGRFTALVRTLQDSDITDVQELRGWLLHPNCCSELLKIPGIGPKTVDYLCCLVGIDCIAVDRHVKRFVKNAGLEITDYDGLKLAVSFAADLLGISRRGFDSWLWKFVSLKPT